MHIYAGETYSVPLSESGAQILMGKFVIGVMTGKVEDIYKVVDFAKGAFHLLAYTGNGRLCS